MKILIANERDIHELTLVEIESKKKSIADLVESFEIESSLRLQRWKTYFEGQTPQTSKKERVVLKAFIDEKIIGYIAGHLTTRYNIDAEIQSFYILKEYQRMGTGTKLLETFLVWVLKHSAQSLCVGIASDNPYQSFYLKHGGRHLNKHWIYWDDLNLLFTKISENKN
jgi:GNAT superfamily N-acetyltransferase